VRKIFLIAFIICAAVLFGFAKTRDASSGLTKPAVIEITERMFVTQITDMYLNPDEYSGKTIKLEGIFGIYKYNDAAYYSVYRNSPGCCGDDGSVGFSVIWDGEYPNNNDWVEAAGVLEYAEVSGSGVFRLNLLSLEVLPNRGAEFVTQ